MTWGTPVLTQPPWKQCTMNNRSRSVIESLTWNSTMFFLGVCKYPTIETTLKHVVIGPLFEGNNCLADAAMYRSHPWRSAMSGVSVDTEFEKGTVAVKRN